MKKCIIALCALVCSVMPVMAQEYMSAEEGADSIKVSYVPQSFWDNWELSLSGGVSVLFNGMGHISGTTSAPAIGSGYQMYDAVGGVGEIAATKWFSPYVAARLGWLTGYLPYNNPNTGNNLTYWHNYGHVDLLWDWTTQFGGYKPNRIYDAVPYVHVGIVGNPGYNVMIGGGPGFLNRFHLNDSWLINLDLRATATSARKFGLPSGVAVDVNALIGVTYRFKEKGWKTKVSNPYGPLINDLRNENEDLHRDLQEANMKNAELARNLQKAQAQKQLDDKVAKEVLYRGLPDTLDMTVYYAISSSKLSSYEQAHLRTYVRMIELSDPNREHRYKVIGTADKGTGSQITNERLSSARAESIKQALLEIGVKEELIQVETKLVPDGDARMARASHVIMYPLPAEE